MSELICLRKQASEAKAELKSRFIEVINALLASGGHTFLPDDTAETVIVTLDKYKDAVTVQRGTFSLELKYDRDKQHWKHTMYVYSNGTPLDKELDRLELVSREFTTIVRGGLKAMDSSAQLLLDYNRNVGGWHELTDQIKKALNSQTPPLLTPRK